jgi:hypothetical protein
MRQESEECGIILVKLKVLLLNWIMGLGPPIIDIIPNRTQYFRVRQFPVFDENLRRALILFISPCELIFYRVKRLYIKTHNNTSCFICF